MGSDHYLDALFAFRRRSLAERFGGGEPHASEPEPDLSGLPRVSFPGPCILAPRVGSKLRIETATLSGDFVVRASEPDPDGFGATLTLEPVERDNP